MNEEKAVEYARCAYINMGNLESMMPMLAKNPFWAVVRDQVKACLKELGDESIAEFVDDRR